MGRSVTVAPGKSGVGSAQVRGEASPTRRILRELLPRTETSMSPFLSLYVHIQSRIATREEKGAAAVEYGLLVALIAAVIVAVVATLGTQVKAAFTTVSAALPVH